MLRALPGMVALAACSSAATEVPGPVANGDGELSEARYSVAELPAEGVAPSAQRLSGEIVQGGLSFWITDPENEVFLDGLPVAMDAEGNFALGFSVLHTDDAELLVVSSNGEEYKETLTVGDREFPMSEVGNLPPSKVQPRTAEQIAKIGQDRKLKNAARTQWTDEPYWKTGWIWPITGRISTRMGADRTLNGAPQNRPHSGVDVARVRGTPWEDFHGKDIVAPADGLVTLAETDLYFEGGTIFIDHGQKIESAMLHLSRVDVEPGEVVRKGDVIGAVGMTGRSSGPHLHWTINWHGTPIDPALLVPPMPE